MSRTLPQMRKQFGVQEFVVDRIVGPDEVIGDQNEPFRRLAIERAATGLGPILPVLHGLDEPGEVFLNGAGTAESNLLGRDQLLQLA